MMKKETGQEKGSFARYLTIAQIVYGIAEEAGILYSKHPNITMTNLAMTLCEVKNSTEPRKKTYIESVISVIKHHQPNARGAMLSERVEALLSEIFGLPRDPQFDFLTHFIVK